FSAYLLHLRSPLFPSTPLFRSNRAHRERLESERVSPASAVGEPAEQSARRESARLSRPERPDRRWHRQGRPEGDGAAQRPQERRDRKSTRLNSSHVETSYAVFC